MTSPALITALFRTWVRVAINYPAELQQVTGLLNSQPRAPTSLRNCTDFAANSNLGELFFLIRTVSCFLHVSRVEVAQQLPGQESDGAAKQGPVRTQQKPGFLWNYHQWEKTATS